MGSIKKRLEALTQSWNETAAREEEERELRIQRTITRLIVAEYARLRADFASDAPKLIELACLNVAHDQYDHLAAGHRESIGLSWAETIRGYTALEWGITTGSLRPPPGWG